MKRSLLLWCFGGYTFSVVLGTLLHFVYDWTKCAIFTPISAVNESTWEHMKILFFPCLFFAVFQYFFFKEYDGFWWIKLIGALVGVFKRQKKVLNFIIKHFLICLFDLVVFIC